MSIVYRDLDRQRQEIRLLELLPSAGPAQALFPVCRLIHSSLLEKPRYTALSYCWGNPERNSFIVVGSSYICIPQNLYEALLAIQPTEGPLTIWIDFICINQENNSEKSWQVGLMKEIYSQAEVVSAWLGPADVDSDLALRSLDTLGKKAEACGFHNDTHIADMIWRALWAVQSLSQPQLTPMAFFGIVLTQFRRAVPAPTMEDWFYLFFGLYHATELTDIFYAISGSHSRESPLPVDSLERLFTRPWWGRVWVLQEIALSARAEFICGSMKISRRRLCAAVNAYGAFRSLLAWRVPNECNPLSADRYQMQLLIRFFLHRPTIMTNAWRVFRTGQFPLVALLRLTCVGSVNLKQHGPHNLESSVACDKIYALLGLASDREELKKKGVYPDYSKSHQEVYTLTTAALLQQGHLSVLSYVQYPKVQNDLPSWVPDWSRSVTNPLQIPNEDHMTMEPKFRASGKTLQKPDVVATGQALSLDGYVYDKIHEVGRFPTRASSSEVPLWETITWPREWLIEILRLTYQKKNNFSTFDERLRAVTRCSVGGTAFLGRHQFEKAGDVRFTDAISLLQYSINLIKNKYIKSEAQRFLTDIETEKNMQDTNVLFLHLSNEIIGRSPRRLPFVTERGHVGVSTDNIQQGDYVAIIKGAEVPYILRLQPTGVYHLIGEAYVDGIMEGEVADTLSYTRITLA